LKKSAIVAFLLIIMMIPGISAQDEVTPLSLTASIYEDGTVDIVYTLECDPGQVRVDVDLFGSTYNNLVIRDDEGYSLDSTTNPTGLSIDSLGASELTIMYRTSSLTTKDGPIWDLNLSSPIETKILLPSKAAIFDLGDIPNDLGTEGGRQYVVLPAGEVYVSYILSFPNPREDAENAITDAESYLSSLENQGYILTDARQELEDAEALFDEESYPEALNAAEESLLIAGQIKAQADDAQAEITAAITAIAQANSQGRTDGLDQAETSLASAESSYENGQYDAAETSATLARTQAQSAEEPSGGNTLLYVGLLVVVAGAAGGYLYMQRLNEASVEVEVPVKNSIFKVNYNAIMADHDDLRLEDREVLKFLAENQGEAYASEIRDRFDLPRSSAWRLIRRLVTLEIVEEVKVGNQSLVKVREKYWE
jgi:uncharacterized membrane protein